MPRGATRRTWVKLFITGWLHGSIRWQLEPDERSVWADLICMAGECGKEGKICDNDNRPYPRTYIANQLNIDQVLLDRTIAKCRHDGRLDDRDDILVITNWSTYQSEYDRQKPYREKARHNAEWDAMSEEDKATAIEAFGPVENWDYMKWIAVTGKLSDQERETINAEIRKEGGQFQIPS